MKIQLIRNATLKIRYDNKTLLIDPKLCSKNTFSPFAKGLSTNPTVDLPLTIDNIVHDIDAVVVTHSHPDHFDDMSEKFLAKEIPLFCTPIDQDLDKFEKFINKQIVHDTICWEGISITRIEGQHGSGPVLPYMGQMSGYILEAEDESRIYIVGDSILTEGVKIAINTYKPQIIICNSGGGIIPGFEGYPVMLNEEETIDLMNESPDSKVIAVHLEAIDFCRVTRTSLRNYAKQNGISEERLIIPADSEVLQFNT